VIRVRRDGDGMFGMIGFEPIEAFVDKISLELVRTGNEYPPIGNLADGEAVKFRTSATEGVTIGGEDISANSSTSMGGEFGRGIEAASSPSCTRLLDIQWCSSLGIVGCKQELGN